MNLKEILKRLKGEKEKREAVKKDSIGEPLEPLTDKEMSRIFNNGIPLIGNWNNESDWEN